jgi:hypothetical protein
MDVLSKSIASNQRAFKLVERINNFAIYETPCHGNSMYEVIRIRTEKAKTLLSGSSFPDRETYPRSSEWGIQGWTFTRNSHLNSLKSAKAKLAELAIR